MKEIFEGKTLTTTINNRFVFYTVKKVINTTSTHLIFIDKFDKEKVIRLIDIIEGSEV